MPIATLKLVPAAAPADPSPIEVVWKVGGRRFVVTLWTDWDYRRLASPPAHAQPAGTGLWAALDCE